MGFRLKVANSCTIISAAGNSFTGASTGNMIFKNLDTGSTYSQTIAWSGTNQSGQANIAVTNLPSP